MNNEKIREPNLQPKNHERMQFNKYDNISDYSNLWKKEK